MFWSRNKSTVTKIAGPMQNKIIHVGIENRSIIHARPVVVPKVSGIAGTDSSTEGIDSANSVIIAIASAGPKSETKLRTLPLKNRVLIKPLNVFAKKKVPNDKMIVISAVAAPTSTEIKGVITEVSASTKKITATSAAKISSVNFVNNRISALASVATRTSSKRPDQIPTHAYTGKKGSPCAWQSSYSSAVKITIGPVPPSIVSGCPEKMAKIIPPTAVATIISTVPISPPVSTLVSAPNAIALARQAKNKKLTEPSTFAFRPSVKSLQ